MIAQLGGETGPVLLAHRLHARELVYGPACRIAEVDVAPGPSRERDDRKVALQRALDHQVEECWHELASCQVTCRAEDDDGKGIVRLIEEMRRGRRLADDLR